MSDWEWVRTPEGGMLLVGVFLGLLAGIALTICVYAWLREAPARRARRNARRLRRAWARKERLARFAQESDLFAEYRQPVRSSGRAPRDIRDFVEGQRNRPTFNPNPGPRDW